MSSAPDEGTRPPAIPHIHSVDLLRGYASLLVCLFHLSAAGAVFESSYISRFLSVGGRDGVSIFFVISGFVIPLSLHRVQYDISQFWRFMLKRIVRIDPPYLVSMAVAVFLWMRFRYSAEGPPLLLNWSTFLFHLGYLIDIARAIGPFDGRWFVTVYWTLAFEFQYYVVVAILFFAIVSTKLSVRMAVLCLFVGAKLAFAYAATINIPIFFSYGDLFFLGILIFQMRSRIVGHAEGAIIAAILFPIICVDNWRFLIYGPVIAFLLLKYDFRSMLSEFLGRISYSLYLYHDSVGGWARGAFVVLAGAGAMQAFAASVVVSIAVAATMYWLIEKPSLRWASQIVYRKSHLRPGKPSRLREASAEKSGDSNLR